MRAFIAIDLDARIKKNLLKFLDSLDKGSRNIKWIKKQGMHVTLEFLGEISDERVLAVESVLKKIANKSKFFPLALTGTGTFPPGKKNPRVLWIGIEENEALKALQSEIEMELEKLGFPREKRKFHPHLTLGRVKAFYGLGPVLSELEKNKVTHFGDMIVKKITFFQSILKPTGAEYSVISEFELK